jgi:hypothetical protein
MQTASSEISKFGSDLKMAAAAFISFEAIKAAGQAVVSFVKGSMDAIDSTRVLAERVGAAVEGFQELQYAAKLSDVSAESFASGMEKLQQKLGEAAVTGAGPAADAFRRLGLNVRSLANAGPVAAFQQIVAALEKVPNAAERAGLEIATMGKGGMGLSGLINAGAKGIADMRREFSELGNPLKQLDFAKVDEANDSLTKIGAVVAGVGNALAVELAPFITYAADLFVDLAKEGLKSGSYISQGFDWVVSGIGFALDGVNVFKTAFHGINMVVAEVVSGFLSGIAKILEGIDFLAHKLGHESDLAGSMRELSKAFGAVAIKELDSAEAAWAKVGKGSETTRKVVNDIVVQADARAKLAIANAPFKPGGLVGAANEKPAFGAAAEFGSKEAYSSIVRNQAGRKDGVQNAIAAATQRTAEGIDRLISMGGGHPRHGEHGRNPVNPAAF